MYIIIVHVFVNWPKPLSFSFLLDSVTISVLQLPAFKHGSNILNESVAACLYLEVEYQTVISCWLESPRWNAENDLFLGRASLKQGIKLIPDSPAEQAVAYQRMMEGLVLTEKLSKLHTLKLDKSAEHKC